MTHAEAVRRELEEIAEAGDGILQPERVIEAAENPASVLHKEFEWDESAAAHLYRLDQAARLIRTVRITIEAREDRSVKVRAYVSLLRDRGVGFRSMRLVLSDAEMRQELLAQARADFLMLERKYRALEEVASVLEVIREVFEEPEQQAAKKSKKRKRRAG